MDYEELESWEVEIKSSRQIFSFVTQNNLSKQSSYTVPILYPGQATVPNTSISPFRPLVKAAQSFPTLCNPMDYTVHGALQARILDWVADPLSRGSSQPRDQTRVSRIAGGFFTS